MDVMEMTEQLQISPLQASDLPGALRLSTQAGWNQTISDWQRVLKLSRPQGRFAGRVDGELVSTGVLIEHGNNCGWVGMILVDERFRRRGLGTAMLDRTIAAADETGLRWIGLDATDMGRPLYLKRGFVDAGHKDRWRIMSPVGKFELAGIEELELSEQVWELDLKATGMDRKAMITAMHANPETTAFLFRDGQCVPGFGLCRRGRIGPYVGPVVARTRQIAAAIVLQLLERLEPGGDRPVFIDVPRGSSLEPWLRSEGFEVVRSWTRMIRGPMEKSNSEMIFGIAGPELG